MNKLTLIYLLGSGHCGSTLLDITLNNHSKIIGVGELENYDPTNEYTGGKSKFWQKVFSNIDWKQNLKVHQTKFNFLANSNKYFYSINHDSPSKLSLVNNKDYAKKSDILYHNINSLSNKPYILDSSKEVPRGELIAKYSHLNVTILHMVRDGRAVMWSYKKKTGNIFKWSVLFKWAFTNIKIEIMKKRLKNTQVILIRYEDLIENPEKEITKILSKFNLDFKPEILEFNKQERHQIGGNRMKLKKEIKLEKDLSWLKNLSYIEIKLFNLIFGWLNRKYGYK